MKPIIMWAGFSDGELQRGRVMNIVGEYAVMPHLYLTKKDACRYYDDVRKVQITEVK